MPRVPIRTIIIHKSSPNGNVVIGRSFRTDEEEILFWLEEAPQDQLELNAWRQRFLETYNTVRSHPDGSSGLTPRKAIGLYLKP